MMTLKMNPDMTTADIGACSWLIKGSREFLYKRSSIARNDSTYTFSVGVEVIPARSGVV